MLNNFSGSGRQQSSVDGNWNRKRLVRKFCLFQSLQTTMLLLYLNINNLQLLQYESLVSSRGDYVEYQKSDLVH